jgi:hypothetical protein
MGVSKWKEGYGDQLEDLVEDQLLVKFRVHSMIQYTDTDVVGNQSTQ